MTTAKKTTLSATLALVGLTACNHANAEASAWRRVAADGTTSLAVRVEGGPKGHTAADLGRPAKEGETIHRVLRGDDGKVLFSYDVVLRRTTDARRYRLALLPATDGSPTFATVREVTATADDDLVRVELLEQATTHEKVLDEYRLTASSRTVEKKLKSIHNMSLMEIHNAVFRWIHSL